MEEIKIEIEVLIDKFESMRMNMEYNANRM